MLSYDRCLERWLERGGVVVVVVDAINVLKLGEPAPNRNYECKRILLVCNFFATPRDIKI